MRGRCVLGGRCFCVSIGANLSPYVTDFLGALLMLTLLLSGGWRIPTKLVESRAMLAMFTATFAGCVLDAAGWLFDGRPGILSRVAVYVCNTLLFSLNVVVGPGYVTIVTRQVHETLPRWHRKVIFVLCVAELALLAINLFTPVVFSVDENNVYHRQAFFWIYMAAEGVLILYGFSLYLHALAKGRLLRFFPAWLFFVLIGAAMLIQSLVYGVSLLWSCVGISFCALIICLQRESIFLDKLTGVYNRYYLDEIQAMLQKRRSGTFAAMMLDMNGFKQINDRFSHAEGDIALVTVANILTEVIDSAGMVARFAGDEFVVLLEDPAEGAVEEYKERILAAIERCNESSGKPYRLSVAIGGCVFDAQKDDISDFLSTIDHRMYADKNEYYQAHGDEERRAQ